MPVGMMGAVLGMVGGVVQGMGAMQAHEAEAQAHEYNAAVAVRNREVIHEQTAASVGDQAEANRREMASVRGMFAANGISYTGSATDAVLDLAKEQTLAVQRINYRGKLMEIEQTDKYNMEMMGASNERAAGQISMVSGILGGLSSGISSFSRMA